MPDFLDQAPIAEADKETIRNMAVGHPFGLRAVIRASPDGFRAHFGEDITERLIDWLEPQLTAQDREILARPVPEFPTGAIIDRPAPPSVTPDEQTKK